MSFLGRLFGRKSGSVYSEGIALYEEGRFPEAIEVLRGVIDAPGHDTGHMADFYLRQSLTRQGRLHLDADEPAEATTYFAEAARRWAAYPDLQFWLGLALARCERWPDVIDAARIALHHNGDYVEARLLEAAALVGLDDRAGAVASLDALVASGARIEHPVIRYLAALAPFSPETIPDDLMSLLQESRSANVGRDAVQRAVDTCRGGSWEEGIDRMRELSRENPTYPDYRVKLAAALFQTGRNSEALDEVDAALTLNPRYRTAAHLKALVLADQHRFSEAREVIQVQDSLTDPVHAHPGEELFSSYLGATLSLLTGRFAEARHQLERWSDLTVTFPTAELLRAASELFDGRHREARRRLEMLSEQWPLDSQYRSFLGCHELSQCDFDRLERTLSQWPDSSADDAGPARKDYLAAQLTLGGGRPLDPGAVPADVAHEPCWRFLEARSFAARDQWVEALLELRKLASEGEATEQLGGLILRAYLAVDETGDAELPDAVPDSLLQDRVCLLHRQERTGRALALIRHHQELHPEDLRWIWLNPTFWLDPIRRWIG